MPAASASCFRASSQAAKSASSAEAGPAARRSTTARTMRRASTTGDLLDGCAGATIRGALGGEDRAFMVNIRSRCRVIPTKRRGSGKLVAEAYRFFLEAFEDDRQAAAAHHPLEAVIPVLSAEHAALEHAAEIQLEIEDCAGGVLASGDAGPRIGAREPVGEAASRFGRMAVVDGDVDMRRHGSVAPAETLAAEPRAPVKLVLEPALELRRLLGRAAQQLLAQRAARAAESEDLHDAPVDGLVLCVHDVLEHAQPRALRRILRQQRRLRPFILEIFEDDRGIEDLQIAVHQCRHLMARILCDEALIAGGAGAERLRHLGLERDALLPERDLAFLCIRRERMLVENDHGWTSLEIVAGHDAFVATQSPARRRA